MNNLQYYKPTTEQLHGTVENVDVCIYGGTSAGVVAARQCSKLGLSCVLLEPGWHLGGLSSGGLGWTDFGRKHAVGGMAREFYRELGKHYGREEEWKFEPHVAEAVFQKWIEQSGVPVYYGHFLATVVRDGNRIAEITMESGLRVVAKLFMDCTYEGDLMAKAGTTYTVGRESNDKYGEEHNGIYVGDKHQFDYPVDPYIEPGQPDSGLLPWVNADAPPQMGAGDHRVQAYCFRMCLSSNPDNQRLFPKPEGYDRMQYELLARYFQAGWRDVFHKYDVLCTGDKTDTNNHGAVSTDFIGANHDYPNATYSEREKIFQAHVTYQQGYMWFLANDSDAPAEIRKEMNRWGLPMDEFIQTGGWPHQLYIREARRMVSDVVMTEHHVFARQTVDDSIGLASYGMDSHNCQRFVKDGRVWNEGDVQIYAKFFEPYRLSYRAITPRKGECTNLIVPVCASATHITYGSIRMEPVFMILAQSGALAASIAIRENRSVQDVPYSALHSLMEKEEQVLHPTKA